MTSFVLCSKLAQFLWHVILGSIHVGFLQNTTLQMAQVEDRSVRVLSRKVGAPLQKKEVRVVASRGNSIAHEVRSLRPTINEPAQPVTKKTTKRLQSRSHSEGRPPKSRRTVQSIPDPLDAQIGTLAQSKKLTKLEMKSISIECQHQYSHYLSKFKAFCEESGLVWPLSSKDADPAMADFMDTLYQEGKQASEGEKTLASFEFHFVNHKGRMVRSRRALKGWRKAYPPSSRLPLPRLLMWGMVMQLIYEGCRQMALMTMAAFWMYLRPGEAHELCGKHVVAPARAAGKQYAWTNVVIRDQEGLRPDKVGVFDNSLPFDLPHIRWIGDLLLQCKKDLKSNKDPLFTFTMEEFRNRFSAVGAKFNVKGLHPYQLRHGGATEDLTAKHRDFAGVKSRGRWRTDQSVRRYAKIGRVQQLLQKISPRDIKFCQWAEKNVKKVWQGLIPAKGIMQ